MVYQELDLPRTLGVNTLFKEEEKCTCMKMYVWCLAVYRKDIIIEKHYLGRV